MWSIVWVEKLHKKYWVDKYVWAKGNFDIYIPFIERVLYGDRPWLVENGKLGFIIPNRVLNVNYARQLRENLPKVAEVLSITDFKAVTFAPGEEDQASRLFKEAMVYPAIVIVKKGSPKGRNYTLRAARFLPRAAPLHPSDAMKELAKALTGGVSYKVLASNNVEYADVFEQASSALGRDGWHLMPEAERRVFAKLEAIGEQQDTSIKAKLPEEQKRRLRSYTTTESGGFAGIQTSLDSTMVLRQIDEDPAKGLLKVRPKGGGSAFWVEKEPLRPFLFGKDVERWYVGWEGWWVIFPYFRHQGRYRFMPSTGYWNFELKRGDSSFSVFAGYPANSPFIDKKYPKLWKYLKANEKEFRGREGGRFKKKKREEWRWYDLAYPRSIESAEEKKLVAQLLARSAQFATDEVGGVHFQAGGKGGGVYGILLKSGWAELYFLGLLNSNVLDFYLRQISSVYSNGYYSYADAFLKELPIAPASDVQRNAIAEVAKVLTEKVSILREYEKVVVNFPNSVTDARRKAGTVPNLEALSRLGEFKNLPKELQANRVSSQNTLLGEVELTIGNGRATLKPELAKLVDSVLQVRGRIARDELLTLQLPERENEQQAYIKQLAAWRKNINQLQADIEALEKELNNAVYEVYGLDDEDKQVIEAYLARF